ncbi:MAG: hypothetical protein QM811_29165 [Pirellulales bacterium]
MPRFSLASSFLALSFVGVLCYADHPDGGPLPGHSLHGESFDEGPRQAAHLMGDTGGPKFPVTTANPKAAKFIDQGVGQLHGFWYYEAERSFRQAAALDPNCAMAYWGMAMANVNNDERALGLIRTAMKHKDNVTDREKRYIDLTSGYYVAWDNARQAKKAAEKAKADEAKAKAEKLDGEKKTDPQDEGSNNEKVDDAKSETSTENEANEPKSDSAKPELTSEEVSKESETAGERPADVRDEPKKPTDKPKNSGAADEKKRPMRRTRRTRKRALKRG